MNSVRVMGVQMRVSNRLSDNVTHITDAILASDADYIVFPEMALTGQTGDFSQKAVERAFDQIAAACRQAYVTAIVSTGFREEDTAHIQSRIISHNGNVLGTHEKLVPTQAEHGWCRPGEELRVFDHHGLTFGCLSGNDLWVRPGLGPYPDPRLTLKLADKGALVVFHSIYSGADPRFTAYHEANLALRAVEGNLYICTANAVASGGPVNCATGVMSPEGEWLVQCPRQGEQTFIYDLELDIELDAQEDAPVETVGEG